MLFIVQSFKFLPNRKKEKNGNMGEHLWMDRLFNQHVRSSELMAHKIHFQLLH